MSMSGCLRCWDTPCTCGYDGYVAVYPLNAEQAAKLKNIAYTRYVEINARLRTVLDEELTRDATPRKIKKDI